jgi:methyltransferase (TIGR00027 family)
VDPIGGSARASSTAAWVAACRTLGARLPRVAQLAQDPFGAAFAPAPVDWLVRHLPRLATVPAWPFLLYMQVRTRTIDDVLHRFVADGGTQVLILGAGYDCRASRFPGELADAHVFEVDHPATQARKRAVLDRAGAHPSRVTYVGWDFEAQPTSELPAALASLGHDPARPTLTIWEGVTMYLTERAIDETVAAVRALSAPGSPLVLTYFDRHQLDRPTVIQRLLTRFVARGGEPFRFGWDPAELSGWMRARGFSLVWDRSAQALARDLLPPRYARWRGPPASRITLLERMTAAVRR